MVNREKLNRMCEGIIEGKALTLSQLNDYGMDKNDLEILIKNGILTENEKDNYALSSVDILYNYAKNLISIGNREKAAQAFKKCYEINPNHYSSYRQLFLDRIKDEDYENVFQYFDIMFSTKNNYRKPDHNLYLYLLSMLTELPDKYKSHIKNLKLPDILLSKRDNRYCDVSKRNKIRLSLLNRRFSHAYAQDKKLRRESTDYSIQDITIGQLLFLINKKQYEIKRYLVELAEEKKYEDIVNYLENLEAKKQLSLSNKYILTITRDLIETKKTGIIPDKTTLDNHDFFGYIRSKNYDLALARNLHFREENISGNDVIYILLTEMNHAIEEINSKITPQQSFEKQEDLIVEKIEAVQEDTIVLDNNYTIVDIAGYLMNQNFDKAYPSINKYLKEKGKEEYQFLIEDLIEISKLNEDTDFITPITTLMLVGLDKLKWGKMGYIESFYESLAQDKFDEASIYLDIIAKSKDLEQDVVLPANIDMLLNNVSEMLDGDNIRTDSSQLIGYLQTLNKEDVLPKKSPVRRKKK